MLYYPRSRYALDALRILGEAAYLERDYDEAIRRFQELRKRVSSREESEQLWIDLAGHRIAMAYFRKTQGPDYDEAGLKRAKAELAGYLETGSSNQDFVDEARASLATVLDWIEEKRLRNARYYLTIDQARGARLSLQELLDDPESERQEEARELMKRVEALEAEQAPASEQG
jgi:outer membrane protein assembly factor BamD (BamD/ComL family)